MVRVRVKVGGRPVRLEHPPFPTARRRTETVELGSSAAVPPGPFGMPRLEALGAEAVGTYFRIRSHDAHGASASRLSCCNRLAASGSTAPKVRCRYSVGR